MKAKLISCIFIVSLMVNGWAHCEIPCGIYNDEARLKTNFRKCENY